MELSRKIWVLIALCLGLFALLVIWRPRTEQVLVTTTPVISTATESWEYWQSPQHGLAPLLRKVYPYSVIPGGIASSEELRAIMKRNPDIARHLKDFNLREAKLVKLNKPRSVYVSYRRGNLIYWTKKRVTLTRGEVVITDGTHTLRARCGNDVSDVPGKPTSPSEPTTGELDTPLPPIPNVTHQPTSLLPTVVASLPPDIFFHDDPPAVLPPETPPPNYSVPPVIYPPFFPPGGSGSIPPTPVTATPEPSTLLLLLLGGAGIGAKCIWEKRTWLKR